MYVLTGSHQPDLQALLTQSLAGRNIPSQATPSFLNFKETTGFIRCFN